MKAILHKNSHCRLYYCITMNYGLTSLQLNAVNYSFKIERTYTAIDDSSYVQKQPDGTWKFKLQTKIQVKLPTTTTQRRYHIALVDYKLAGCNALDTKLKGILTYDTNSSVKKIKKK